MFERSGFEQVRAGTGGPVPLRHTCTALCPCALSLACYEVLASHTTPATPRGRTPRTARPGGTGPGADLAGGAGADLTEPRGGLDTRYALALAGGAPGGRGACTVALQYRPARV